ncbi:uncharacterized protein LOC116343790 [Contarinia nasturtii]|uniref:uncharacterized protein LOC116343790 n=1 Tax=Contarinia nasturtii TaxID=265458 RepID=UPI0012D3FEA5|nr:uncharacterized protein LOC116343790 [Contarinia nasturtii]
MASLPMIIACLALFGVCNFVHSVTWGELDEKIELNNIGVVLSATASKPVHQNLTKTVKEPKNLTKTVDEPKNLTKNVQDENLKVDFSPRFLLEPRANTPSASSRSTVTYKLGKRVSGDRVVASDSQIQQWTAAQNVTQNITYPKTGVGSIISFVEIVVEQSTNLGRGYVTSGGVGQRQISITIEAQRTTLFRQTTQIYGY